MANYPIKILIDEQGKEFVPFVNTDVVYFPDGSTLSNALDTKADKTTLAADKAELQANIDKKADITAMEQTLVDAKAYTDERVTSVYRYQGSVKNYNSLPTENLTVGDVYDTQEAQEGHEAGANYAWNGTTWDKLGMTLDYSKLQSTEAAAAQDAQIALRTKKEDITGGENIQVTYSGDTGVKIDTKIADDLKTEDAHTSLSANQGVVLSKRVAPAGGQTNQVLAKVSDSNYDMAWVKAADPNSIIGDGSIVKIIEVTYDEYLALQDAGQVDPDIEYHIADYDGDNISTIGETAIQTMIDRSVQDHVTATVPGQEQPVHANATTEAAGFMSATDKTKLDSVSLNAVSKEDLATELATIVPEATIDSKIATATEDFISETTIDGKISAATSDKINSTQAQTLIDNSTKDFVTNTEAQALVSNGVADKITTTAAQTMVNNAVADKITSTQAQTLVNNKVADYLPLSGGTLTGAITLPYGRYAVNGEFGINANNSDITGVGGIVFNDISDVGGEGILFPRTDGNYDTISAYNGVPYFRPGHALSDETQSGRVALITYPEFKGTTLYEGSGLTEDAVHSINVSGYRMLKVNLTAVGQSTVYDKVTGNGINQVIWIDLEVPSSDYICSVDGVKYRYGGTSTYLDMQFFFGMTDDPGMFFTGVFVSEDKTKIYVGNSGYVVLGQTGPQVNYGGSYEKITRIVGYK